MRAFANLLDDPIAGARFARLCGADPQAEAPAGEPAYCRTQFVHHHLDRDWPRVAVLHNSDQTFNDDRLLDLLRRGVRHVFAMNCASQDVRATALPIGLRNAPDLVGVMRRIDTEQSRTNLAYLCATIGRRVAWHRRERKRLYRVFGPEDWCTAEGGESIDDVPFGRYCEQLATHKYALSPPGAGIDCHRTWEAMYLGCIPIVRRTREMEPFDGLPLLMVNDWPEVCYKRLVSEYDRLAVRFSDPAVMERLAFGYWAERIRTACANHSMRCAAERHDADLAGAWSDVPRGRSDQDPSGA